MATDYFGVLGVARGASDSDIKRAYRRLARDLHPDVNPDPEAKERFQEVTRAYEALTDPEKRRIVDLGGDPFDTAGGGGAGGFGGAGFGGLGDIMDAFFGGRGHPRPAQPHPRRARRAHPDRARARRDGLRDDEGHHRRHRRPLHRVHRRRHRARHARRPPAPRARAAARCRASSAASSARSSPAGAAPRCAGTGQVIPEPCPECAGDGRVRSRRTLQVKVPAGVEDGMRIRLTGQGEVGPGGGPAGDLYVEIHERPHDVFTRDGEDLHCRVTLPMTAAALGTTLSLKTLDGEEDIDIRPGTQSGSVLTLRAHGAPRLRGHRAGQPRRARRGLHARPAWTPSRRSCCASSPRCAARTRPTPTARRRAGCSPGSATRSTGAEMTDLRRGRPRAGRRADVHRRRAAPRPTSCSSTAPRAGTRSRCCGSRPASGCGSATARAPSPRATCCSAGAEGLRVAVVARFEVPGARSGVRAGPGAAEG